MANRSMLLGRNGKELDYSEGVDILVAGSYYIPLFWFTLYSAEDIVLKEIEMKNGSLEQCPTLIIDYNVAKLRVSERKNYIFSIIPKAYNELYDIWMKFIDSIKAPYLQIDMTEIWMMADDLNVFNENLKKALNVFSRLNQNDISVLLNEYVGIKVQKKLFTKKIIHPEAEKEIVSLLCGYSWIKEVPWEK